MRAAEPCLAHFLLTAHQQIFIIYRNVQDSVTHHQYMQLSDTFICRPNIHTETFIKSWKNTHTDTQSWTLDRGDINSEFRPPSSGVKRSYFSTFTSIPPNHKYWFHLWHSSPTALNQSTYTFLCEGKQHAQEFIDCDWCLITILQAEKKHKSFQELDRFMHYYTRFKNHEHSYQVNRAGFACQWYLLCIVYKQLQI